MMDAVDPKTKADTGLYIKVSIMRNMLEWVEGSC